MKKRHINLAKHIILMQLYNNKLKINGFASLVGVIILSIVVLSVVVMGSILSIDSNRFNKNSNDSIFVSGVLRSCVENSLDKLKADTNYSGNETFLLDNVTCNILTISGTGNTNRVLKVSAVATNTGSTYSVVKKAQIDINTINPYYILNSWQEVADFY